MKTYNNYGKYFKLMIMLIVISSFLLSGCGVSNKSNTDENNSSTANSTNDETQEKSDSESSGSLPIATITVDGYGVMEAELYPEVAKNTVNNFISLADKGFYNNLTFHRIIKGFMIQGGDPNGDGTGGPGYSIEGEFTSNGIANSLKHTKGVLSMARTQDPNSAGSQFFIMTGDSPNLDGEYAAFGKVISGLDVLEKIENVKTGANDAPKDKVVIKSITIDKKGIEYKEPIKK